MSDAIRKSAFSNAFRRNALQTLPILDPLWSDCVGFPAVLVRLAVLQRSNVGLYPFVAFASAWIRGIAVAIAKWIRDVQYGSSLVRRKQHIRLKRHVALPSRVSISAVIAA